MQKRSKKGFTLAELLIVVAIIAVLVAIAVPLFVSSLTKAEKARDNANIRSLRAAAVTYILTVDKTEDETNYNLIYCNNGKLSDKGYKVTATLGANGDFSEFTFAELTGPSDGEEEVTEAQGKTTVTCFVKPTQYKNA